MPLEFRTQRVSFPSRRDAEQSISQTVTFSRRVLSVGLAMNGLDTTYRNGDHHLLRLKADISQPSVADRSVTFSVNLLLRDSSGEIDDPFSGFVDVLLIAEVA